MKDWFTVDKDGLAKVLGRRGKAETDDSGLRMSFLATSVNGQDRFVLRSRKRTIPGHALSGHGRLGANR